MYISKPGKDPKFATKNDSEEISDEEYDHQLSANIIYFTTCPSCGCSFSFKNHEGHYAGYDHNRIEQLIGIFCPMEFCKKEVVYDPQAPRKQRF